MKKQTLRSALFPLVGGCAFLAMGPVANAGGAGTAAGPVTEAGESIGLALGAALPKGVYFLDLASVVHNPGANAYSGKTLDVLVNIPVVAWSTPWDLLGGHVEAYAALPEAVVDSKGLGSQKPYGGSAGLYNPALLVGEAWDLGGGFHFSDFIGGYAPVNQPGFSYANGTNNVWTFNERAALTYISNGYTVTVHGVYGTSTNTDEATETNSHGVSCAHVSCRRADYLNVDMTATKDIGKWQVGPVGYYSVDVSRSSDELPGNRQFALGGLVGYSLPGMTVQAYATHDLMVGPGHLLGGQDTRYYLHFIVPIF